MGVIGVLWGCCGPAASVSKGLDSAKGCDCEGLAWLWGDDGRLRGDVEGDRGLRKRSNRDGGTENQPDGAAHRDGVSRISLSAATPVLVSFRLDSNIRICYDWCMKNSILITAGDVFGRLTVIREVSPKVSGKQVQRCVECRCECGVVKEYRLYTLRSGKTKSCGCLAREVVGSGLKTHGLSHTVEYGIWHGMLRRCLNEKEDSYRNYGGRGIAVCDRWRSFESFYEDMGPRPSSKHSIDRINNDGNYEPGNCRWATQKEQARNTRVNYLVEHNGEVKCVADWAEQYGFKASVLYIRLVKLGWTFEKATTWPVFNKSATRACHPHYRVKMSERDASWHREHERLEVLRIAKDRRELELCGDSLSRTHRVDAVEFKSRVDAALSEGWAWNGAILRALHEMGAVAYPTGN